MALIFKLIDFLSKFILCLLKFFGSFLVVFSWGPEYAHWLGTVTDNVVSFLLGLYEVREPLKVFELLLIAHLLIQNDELPFNISPLSQFS